MAPNQLIYLIMYVSNRLEKVIYINLVVNISGNTEQSFGIRSISNWYKIPRKAELLEGRLRQFANATQIRIIARRSSCVTRWWSLLITLWELRNENFIGHKTSLPFRKINHHKLRF